MFSARKRNESGEKKNKSLEDFSFPLYLTGLTPYPINIYLNIKYI